MELKDFFAKHPRVALAFSGGVDSAYLLYAAVQYAQEVGVYYVKAEFQPQFEQRDALRLAEQLGVRLRLLDVQLLANPQIRENPRNRCYYCKRAILEAIREAAAADGFTVLLDGTNASDSVEERPGMQALTELAVFSPLRECGLKKAQIRQLSREAGLFTWDKPAYACLATRIAPGEELTREKLSVTELAEDYLFSLGFTDFRIRSQNGHARLQLPEPQTALLWQQRSAIVAQLKKYYKTVALDLEVTNYK